MNQCLFGSDLGDIKILKSLSKKSYRKKAFENIFLKAKTTKAHFKRNLQYLEMKYLTGT